MWFSFEQSIEIEEERKTKVASLTHVCMWGDKGWKRVTAAEAARIHPGGKVSAHSGLFMCELCGQYVLLTDGTVQVRHFRHSSSEKSKNCPERTFGPGAVITYNAGEHELPIRICNITKRGFDLELGFIQVPQKLLTKQLKIEIKKSLYGNPQLVYSKERLNTKGVTYLSVGGSPSEQYYLHISGTSDEIHQFWPKRVQGIDPSGTMFDAASGKRLVYDSDVIVGKKYFLLRRGIAIGINHSHITIKEILRKTISWETWCLYEVTARDYNKDAARFFLDYHCRLTENPVSIQTVWPVYIENPYIVKHNQKSVVMHIKGNAPTARTFPSAAIKEFPSKHGKVLEINCNNRQQLISAGRTKALQYTYFWKEPLNATTSKPKVEVTDLRNVSFTEGQYDDIPNKGILRITVPYDGTVSIRIKGFLVDRRRLPANIPIEVDGISWGMELDICVGLDSVWRASFIRRNKSSVAGEETEILHRLQSHRGPTMAAPHTLGCTAMKLAGYPTIQKWVYKCIREGYMSEQAYRDLQALIISGNC